MKYKSKLLNSMSGVFITVIGKETKWPIFWLIGVAGVEKRFSVWTTTGCLKMLEVSCEWRKFNFPLLEGKYMEILSLERNMYRIYNFDVPRPFYPAK